MFSDSVVWVLAASRCEHSASMYLQSGVDTYLGTAKFVDTKVIEMDGQQFTADHITIAVGGMPIVPGIPGSEHGITSDGFFELETLPK